jgi:hypothetical protein
MAKYMERKTSATKRETQQQAGRLQTVAADRGLTVTKLENGAWLARDAEGNARGISGSKAGLTRSIQSIEVVSKTPRTKLGNQIQKGIREGKTPLPADPFQGFREPRTKEDRIQGLIGQIKRDTAVLKGPPEYIVDKQFYEERIAGTRETIRQLSPDLEHLKRENAIPATAPHPTGEPKTSVDYASEHKARMADIRAKSEAKFTKALDKVDPVSRETVQAVSAEHKAEQMARRHATSVKLTDNEAKFFDGYYKDAGNWSGSPLVGGNVTILGDKEDRGLLAHLKRQGLVVTNGDEGDTFLTFTKKGEALARARGLEPHGFEKEAPGQEVKGDLEHEVKATIAKADQVLKKFNSLTGEQQAQVGERLSRADQKRKSREARKARSVEGEKRVPAGPSPNPHGGEWTK